MHLDAFRCLKRVWNDFLIQKGANHKHPRHQRNGDPGGPGLTGTETYRCSCIHPFLKLAEDFALLSGNRCCECQYLVITRNLTLTNFDQLWPKAAQGTQAAVISSSNFRQLPSCSRASFLSWANSLATTTSKKHPCMAPQINYQLWLIWEETWGHKGNIALHGLMIECWILHIFLQQPSQELVRYKQHTLLWNAGHVLLQTCSSRNNTWTVKNYSFTCQSEDPNNSMTASCSRIF